MYKKIGIGFVLFGLLSVLFVACSVHEPVAVTGPTVHMGGSTFIQKSVTLKKGDMLILVDDVASNHIITNGMWVGNNQKPAKEAGAPTVNATYNGNDSSPVGPFTTAGTFHLYCTIHLGMNLDVKVQ